MHPTFFIVAFGLGGLVAAQSLSQQSDMAQAQLLTCLDTCSDKIDAQIESGCGVSSSDDQAIPCICASNDLKTALLGCASQTCAGHASDAKILLDKLCEVSTPEATGPINDCIGNCSVQVRPSCPEATTGDELITCECTNDTVRNAYDSCMMQTCQDIAINAIFTTNILCATRLINDTTSDSTSGGAPGASGSNTPTKDKDNSASSIPLASGLSWIAALATVAVAACL